MRRNPQVEELLSKRAPKNLYPTNLDDLYQLAIETFKDSDVEVKNRNHLDAKPPFPPYFGYKQLLISCGGIVISCIRGEATRGLFEIYDNSTASLKFNDYEQYRTECEVIERLINIFA